MEHYYRHQLGSPPRMRGKLARKIEGYARSRITPADAGKTQSTRQARPRNRDHPRGCGENCACMRGCCRGYGSPPRMRGKHTLTATATVKTGITPADAGKTIIPAARRSGSGDHPRGCGENKTTLRQCSYRLRIIPAGAGKTRENRRNPAQAAGSPPQVRGKRRPFIHRRFYILITPAGAGKTD